MSEKLVEFMVDDLGNLQIAVRPTFPSAPESFRVSEDGERIRILMEDGRVLALDIPAELQADVRRCSQALVSEFRDQLPEPVRETDILLHASSDFPV